MGGTVMFADSVSQKIRVWINGHEVQDGGYVIDGKTYVPIREFDGLVNWDGDANKVNYIKPNVHIFLFKGDTVFGNVNKGKLKFNVFCQVDSLSEPVSSVKVAITDPTGHVKDIQSQDLGSNQKDNFWFRTYDFTYDFKTSGKYKVGFYIKASKNDDYTLVSEKVITALN
ncbi:copper amine oxidase N-terminal domain-containing protein [Paenibacillus sp. KQZ6P-2]|uniref:Copper amine oxidase N-terminal domain-containing protein n=1 Tax=Paenibacillus mangrovi TaxID=2931978 RepID=A0A9X1WLT6_9BACL|nr:copper amine oxidase N-terminal domain-containing protein [Paenibacillus mangrovi]MCJ8011318.1 copper amine oxidase N-terminal domain-containing protein [Paenibacillus mangrovi]